ncbi:MULTISPECIES: hypothetical protein [Sorangium]|nr:MULTISPECIES: hypothetical protein [Sorangium]
MRSTTKDGKCTQDPSLLRRELVGDERAASGAAPRGGATKKMRPRVDPARPRSSPC